MFYLKKKYKVSIVKKIKLKMKYYYEYLLKKKQVFILY